MSPVKILLVEDNPADVEVIREVLLDAEIGFEMQVANDGEEALSILHQCGKNSGEACPDMILLDLNLPRKSGHEVLSEIKEDPYLTHIPVIILTSSSFDQDIAESYELRANSYITKPADFSEFSNIVKVIEQFWVSLVRLPDGSDGTKNNVG